MLLHVFPPGGGGGVLRPLKFATHLSRFGWLPVILTIREEDCRGHDPSLLERLPDEVEIHRTRTLLPPRRTAEMRVAEGTTTAEDERMTHGLRGRLRDLLLVPDSRVAWWPFAAYRALRIHRGAGFDAIYSTSPPNSTHLLGRWLKHRTGRPLVCDFRDPWSHAFEETRAHERPSRRRAETRMERRVIRDADAIVVTAPGFQDLLRDAHPSEPESKFHLITNGYDPDDYADITPKRFDRFAIVYTGKAQAMYGPELFFDGLRRLVAERADVAERCEVHFLGEFDPTLRSLVKEPPLSRMVTFHGHTPHAETLAYQLGADVLLLTLADLEAMRVRRISGKVFEYIYAGAPILGLVPPASPTADVIREVDGGVVVPPGDVGEVATAIGRFFDSYASGELRAEIEGSRTARRDAIAHYSRMALTEGLAGILNDRQR